MKLTGEQIAELAPEWATHYSIGRAFHGILFESNDFFAIFYFYGGFGERSSQMPHGINKNSKPIPRKPKPFDITQHEWSDEAKDCGVSFRVPAWVLPDIEISIKDIDGGDNTAALLREHAIAIAKHFSLTAEDLKC